MGWAFGPLLPSAAQQQAAAGSTYTLTAAAGVFALTGEAVGLRCSLRLPAAAATFAETGGTAALRRGYTLAAAAGVCAFTGQPADFISGNFVSAAVGAFSAGGQAAGMRRALRLTAATATFSGTGGTAALRRGLVLAAGPGGLALTGEAVGLRCSRRLTAAGVSFVEAGAAAAFIRARGMTSMTIWQAVHNAVYGLLDTALTGVAAVYDAVPHNAAYPYVDLAAQNRTPADTLSTRGHNFQLYPAVYSQHKGPQEVRAILDAMDAALHNACFTLATGHAVRCRVTDAKCMRDADGRSYQGGATIELFVVT